MIWLEIASQSQDLTLGILGRIRHYDHGGRLRKLAGFELGA